MKYLIMCLAVFVTNVHANDRLYTTNVVGEIQYQYGSLSIRNNGRIYQTDNVGNTLYNKPSYKIVGNKVYQTDTVGNTLYNKPAITVKK